MLISETIEISGSPKNISRYKRLGYICTFGEPFVVKVSDLPKTSQYRIEIICDYCGTKFTKTYETYLRGQKVGCKDACSQCASIKRNENYASLPQEQRNDIEMAALTKRIKTNQLRYGVTNPMQINTIQQKQQDAVIEKYGVDNVFKDSDIQHKQRNTMQQKYGVSYALQHSTFLEKVRATNLERYGNVCYLHSDIGKEAVKQTALSKYNSQYIINAPSIVSKIKNTNQIKYGVDYPLQNPLILYKTKQSLLKNGGSIVASAQQINLAKLYNGILNYPIGVYFADIYVQEYNLVVEYNGGGHNLSVVFGYTSEAEFNKKEEIRLNYLNKHDYKVFVIENLTDKSFSDEYYIHIYNIAKSKLIKQDYNLYKYNINTGEEFCK